MTKSNLGGRGLLQSRGHGGKPGQELRRVGTWSQELKQILGGRLLPVAPPTGRSDGGNFSTEVPSSQGTLVYV